MSKHPKIQPDDLMEAVEVAAAYGVTLSSLHVALAQPDVYPALARRVPPPLRKIGRSRVWSRHDVEAALAAEQVDS